MMIDDMVSKIPMFISSDVEIKALSNEFLKEKLLSSEKNENIYRVSRGDNQLKTMSLIGDFNTFFNWGLKSNHSFWEDSEIREFLEAETINKEIMFDLVNNNIDGNLNYHFQNYRHYVKGDRPSFINQINESIHNTQAKEDLLFIKEFILYFLHTMGNDKFFRKVTPWISTSYGKNRFNVALRFARHNLRRSNKYKISPYIILDYWTPRVNEGYTFIKTSEVIKRLKLFGIDWHRDANSEIMLKYCMFPHQLIGYYYFENEQLTYYCFNPHYIKRWIEDNTFLIGDNLYINQEHVDFPADNLYKIIYLKEKNKISTFNKR
ncbi:hypothetical protein [Metabacillus fastidiosus]|uniref:hypothetical protein n=1 Tax=Metabacillus fastidiosus TaxID=1458 RepID=UPI003D2E73DF